MAKFEINENPTISEVPEIIASLSLVTIEKLIKLQLYEELVAYIQTLTDEVVTEDNLLDIIKRMVGMYDPDPYTQFISILKWEDSESSDPRATMIAEYIRDVYM